MAPAQKLGHNLRHAGGKKGKEGGRKGGEEGGRKGEEKMRNQETLYYYGIHGRVILFVNLL